MDRLLYLTCRWQNNWYLARGIIHALSERGFAVFFDPHSAQFTSYHAAHIDARPHLLALLSPFALDQFAYAEVRLREEIAYAGERLRVVTLAACYDASLGEITMLRHFRTARLRVDALEASIESLIEKHLSKRGFGELTPLPPDMPDPLPPPSANELTAEALLNRALSHPRADYESKFADYSEALALNPSYPQAYYNRAIVRNRLGDPYGALDDYAAAIELNPSLYQALTNRAELLYVLGSFEEALAHYQGALEVNPPDDRVERAGYALTLFALGEVDDAITVWLTLIAADERFHDADWTGRELRLPSPMIDAVRQLLHHLPPTP